MKLRAHVGLAIGSGIAAALAMSAYFLFARLVFGIPTPSESFADASAPLIPVHLFGLIIGLAHGYTQLKIFGFASVLFGQIVVGALAGYLYVVRAHRAPRFLVGFASIAWLVTAVAFASVLSANYRGVGAALAVAATIVSLAIGFTIFAVVLGFLAGGRPANDIEASPPAHASRRSVLIGGLSTIAVAVGMQRMFARATFGYDGRMYEGADVVVVTPNDRFYCVTKNFADPTVDANLWRLEVRGAVDIPKTYDLEALRALAAVEQETTLMCINNAPEGGLMSNALWGGVPMSTLLAAARPQAGAVRIVMHASDTYIDTIPFEKAMLPTTLVALGMNGVALPREHGYPVRAIVPGWFGEKSVKWLRAIEIVTTPVRGFYERQGWGPDFRIPTHSRFDAPDFSRMLSLGAPIALSGVAFCGDRGVSAVEVSFDDGVSWSRARLVSHAAPLAWRLWQYDWTPAHNGEFKLAVRAYDREGRPQTAVDRGAETEGATGLHRVTARVG